jgi:hypothetical protein
MNQDNKNSDKSKKKLLVTERVLSALDQMVDLGVDKNHTKIAMRIGLDYKNRSRYKNGERIIGPDVIYEAVNELGLNPKYIFLEDGPTTEKLMLENSIHIAGNVGDNNVITNEHNANKPVVTGNSIGGNLTIVHSLEKLINEVPPDLRDKIHEHINHMAGEIAGLKKIVDEHKKELVEKKEELIEYKKELVENRKDLRKKDEKLIAVLDELNNTQKKVTEVQDKYAQILEQSKKQK